MQRSLERLQRKVRTDRRSAHGLPKAAPLLGTRRAAFTAVKWLPCLLMMLVAAMLSSCSEPACVPSCGGKECGDDGCGGTCGTCGDALVCSPGAVCTRCGNGTLDDGEVCDPGTEFGCPSPESCQSETSCFVAEFSGSVDACDAVCETATIVDCMSGDGCCPIGCGPGNDVDCAPPECGNGRIDGNESCDPPEIPCEASCEPEGACQEAVFWGFEAACTRECKRTDITACRFDADGCCPAGCTAGNDPDCDPAVCGDALVTGAETCDAALVFPAPGSCSPDCDDGRACTTDLQLGSVAGCDVRCQRTLSAQCQAGDGCCPAGCDTASDADCGLVVCGDGVVDGDEGCDNAIAAGFPGACPASVGVCDDADPCTVDTFEGVAADCSARCVHTQRSCGAADACCPAACTANNDPECAALDLCERYCSDAMMYCEGPNELFASRSACLQACGDMPTGIEDEQAGDSVACRIHHLIDASSDPDGHCLHSAASPVGGCE